MKKLVLVLVAMFGLYLGANAQVVLSCDVYNADGLTAKLCQKGAQSSDHGELSIPVEVTAKSGSKYASGQYMVTVSVEVIEQDNRSVVKREDVIVWVKNGRGYTSKTVNKQDGYKPNHDYLFSINKDRTCM